MCACVCVCVCVHTTIQRFGPVSHLSQGLMPPLWKATPRARFLCLGVSNTRCRPVVHACVFMCVCVFLCARVCVCVRERERHTEREREREREFGRLYDTPFPKLPSNTTTPLVSATTTTSITTTRNTNNNHHLCRCLGLVLGFILVPRLIQHVSNV